MSALANKVVLTGIIGLSGLMLVPPVAGAIERAYPDRDKATQASDVRGFAISVAAAAILGLLIQQDMRYWLVLASAALMYIGGIYLEPSP